MKMKAIYGILVMAILVMAIAPLVSAAGIGAGLGGSIGVEEFPPVVWQCGGRVVLDDAAGIQPWRVSNESEEIVERLNHYIFEGERYEVDVVVFDKNKIEEINVDLVLTPETSGDVIMGNCEPIDMKDVNFEDCNAGIGEEEILIPEEDTMAAYRCFIDIPGAEIAAGEYWLSVQAIDDAEADAGEFAEIELWTVNPEIGLDVIGDLAFDEVRPGTASYSTVLVKNPSDGGVILDMFIAGKNWGAVPDADGKIGRCKDGTSLVNFLPLSAFRYHATNGAYSTRNDVAKDSGYSSVLRDKDAEGYVNINYLINDGFEENMFKDAEIIQAAPIDSGDLGYAANLLTAGGPGMSMTFRLILPEPCYGEYEADEGIVIFGEAV